jgi:hypothetical protein
MRWIYALLLSLAMSAATARVAAADLWQDVNPLADPVIAENALVLVVLPAPAPEPEEADTAEEPKAKPAAEVRNARLDVLRQSFGSAFAARVTDVRTDGRLVLEAEQRVVTGDRQTTTRVSGFASAEAVDAGFVVPLHRLSNLLVIRTERRLEREATE